MAQLSDTDFDVNCETTARFSREFRAFAATSAVASLFLINSVNAADLTEDCTLNGFPLYGDVQVVDSFPDIKVQIVTSFPDLKVEVVDSFPDDCGQWRFVESFPDVKVQFVESFPDLKIRYVDSFPGVP